MALLVPQLALAQSAVYGNATPLRPTLSGASGDSYGSTSGYGSGQGSGYGTAARRSGSRGTSADSSALYGASDPNADPNADPYADPSADPSAPVDPNAQPTTTSPRRTSDARSGTARDVDLRDDLSDLRRQNLREQRVDEFTPRRPPEPREALTPGIRVGTMILRPSISESLATERTRTSGVTDTRSYLETGLKGSLTSDWSRHSLIVNGQGRWQKNLEGDEPTKPFAGIDGDLRLDISRDTTGHITAGYDFSREDTDDPNAIAGAKQQSGVNRFLGGLSLEHDFGILRGTVGVDAERWRYGDAKLSDGTIVSLKDRDRDSATLRGRIGYELSPVLIPFVEASYGRVEYDRATDIAGYARSGDLYGAKGGITADFGEKLRGEIGLGYKVETFDDGRLADLEGFSADGSLAWSPQRGTDVDLRLSTTLEPSTTAGENGYVAYALSSALAHQIDSRWLARLTASSTWNRYDTNVNDSVTYVTGAGVTYGINRYVDLTADLGYEVTDRENSADTQILRAGIGITAKR